MKFTSISNKIEPFLEEGTSTKKMPHKAVLWCISLIDAWNRKGQLSVDSVASEQALGVIKKKKKKGKVEKAMGESQ